MSAAVFCLPQSYGWSWGLAIQAWALFGLIKLYRLSEPRADDSPRLSLPARLRRSLSRRRRAEGDQVSGRVAGWDAMLILLAGAALMLWIVLSGWQGIDDGAALQRSLYTTLYLVAQLFCMGVIVFLAQLYAARRQFVLIGFLVCAGICLCAMIYSIGRYGWAAFPAASESWLASAQGTDIYLLGHEGIAPLTLRLRAMGLIGAFLPWLAAGCMLWPVIGTLLCPPRRKGIALMALGLAALLGVYDVLGVRGALHFVVVLPAWAALALAWGRVGYGPVYPAFRRGPSADARALANLQ